MNFEKYVDDLTQEEKEALEEVPDFVMEAMVSVLYDIANIVATYDEIVMLLMEALHASTFLDPTNEIKSLVLTMEATSKLDKVRETIATL